MTRGKNSSSFSRGLVISPKNRFCFHVENQIGIFGACKCDKPCGQMRGRGVAQKNSILDNRYIGFVLDKKDVSLYLFLNETGKPAAAEIS